SNARAGSEDLAGREINPPIFDHDSASESRTDSCAHCAKTRRRKAAEGSVEVLGNSKAGSRERQRGSIQQRIVGDHASTGEIRTGSRAATSEVTGALR